jgi:hypothetical protein
MEMQNSMDLELQSCCVVRMVEMDSYRLLLRWRFRLR